eukprot:365300-Chlamydomonas_euryale.AAC.11
MWIVGWHVRCWTEGELLNYVERWEDLDVLSVQHQVYRPLQQLLQRQQQYSKRITTTVCGHRPLSCIKSIKYQASEIKHQASSIRDEASSIKHQHQASGMKHQTSSIKHQG